MFSVMDQPPSTGRRKTFYQFCTKLFEYGFSATSWNFFEASHGKGAADTAGAVLKRTADKLIKQGTDLPTPCDVFTKLQGITNVERTAFC